MLTGLPISGSAATNCTSKPSGTTNARKASAGLRHGVERTISSKADAVLSAAIEAMDSTAHPPAKLRIRTRLRPIIDTHSNPETTPRVGRTSGSVHAAGVMVAVEQTREFTDKQTCLLGSYGERNRALGRFAQRDGIEPSPMGLNRQGCLLASES